LKTVDGASRPWVRIPPPPLFEPQSGHERVLRRVLASFRSASIRSTRSCTITLVRSDRRAPPNSGSAPKAHRGLIAAHHARLVRVSGAVANAAIARSGKPGVPALAESYRRRRGARPQPDRRGHRATEQSDEDATSGALAQKKKLAIGYGDAGHRSTSVGARTPPRLRRLDGHAKTLPASVCMTDAMQEPALGNGGAAGAGPCSKGPHGPG
jgi:hypothetical protein